MHNFADKDCTVTFHLLGWPAPRLIPLLNSREDAPLEGLTVRVEGYGYRW